MPYFELPDDPELKPYLPYLKLILLYIIISRSNDFAINKIKMPNNKLQFLVLNAVQKALKAAVSISIEDLQRRENIIAELLSDYEPKSVLTLKNKIIDSYHNFIAFSGFYEEYNGKINNNESEKQLLPVDLIVSAEQYFKDKKAGLVCINAKSFTKDLIKALVNKNIGLLFDNKGLALTLIFRKFIFFGNALIDFLIDQFDISSEAIFKLLVFNDTATLLALYRLKPQLAQNLSSETLLHVNPDDDTSAFYCLADTKDGREILANHAYLLKMVTTEALCHINPDNNTSAFYYLAANEDGREILANHPYLLKMVTSEALCHINPDDDTSAFYWLTSSDSGMEILKNNPYLLKMITAKALCHITPDDDTSAFYWLTSSDSGMEILKNNPYLLKMITAKALCHITPDDNTSAFYHLTFSTTQEVDVLENNPDLLQLVTPEALCQITLEKNDSAFYRLALSESEGFNILKNNPHLLKMVTPETFCCIDNTYDASPFYWLTQEEEMEILTSNTDLLSMLNKEALYHRQINQANNPFCDLARDNTGIKILQQIFECNTQLANTITLEELKAPIRLNYNLVTNMYDILSKTAEGQRILDKLPCTYNVNDKKRKIENITSINETSQQIILNPSTFFQASSSNAMDIVENQPSTNIADQGMHYDDLAEPPAAKR